MDSAARELGCAVIPAGPGNTEQQLEVIAAYRPLPPAGTPDFKILIEAADARSVDISLDQTRGGLPGAAFPPSLQTGQSAA